MLDSRRDAPLFGDAGDRLVAGDAWGNAKADDAAPAA
jgi:hypothetical protein